VPLPAFLVEALKAQRARFGADLEPGALVFPSRSGGPLRRNNFRRRVWLPSLVRAGLLGQVVELDGGWKATWRAATGRESTSVHPTEREAVAQVAKHATGGLRFHDLRHSYATWLVTEGVPMNVVRKVMGHEQTSTTLDIYTHTPDDYAGRVLAALDGPAAFSLPDLGGDQEEDQADEDDDGV
jgi:integrase